MSKEPMVFVNGMIVKNFDFPSGGSCTKVSFKVDEFIEFANQNQNNGWLNVDIMTNREGKMYAKLNTYKKEQSTPQDTNNQDTSYQGEHNQAPQGNGFPEVPQQADTNVDQLDDKEDVPF